MTSTIRTGKPMAEPTGQDARGPILPPPPPTQDRDAEAQAKQAEREAKAAERERAKAARAAKTAERKQAAAEKAERAKADKAAAEKVEQERRDRESVAAEAERERESDRVDQTASMAVVSPGAAEGKPRDARSRDERAVKPSPASRRTRRAQLRLVQLDAWSVMKTAFLLSIALGIVLVVSVAIIWSVLGAAGVWESINSIVQQAVGNQDGPQFDITDYVGTSRVLGIAMIVAVADVLLITAIATLGAFLYNLSAALLGGIEVTLAEDN
jgi:hypothetical protein